MGNRAKITKEWLFETCDGIYSETGQVPTYEELLKLAGGGSKGTIRKWLPVWRAERLPKPTESPDVSDTFVGVAKEEFGKARASGRLEVEQELTRLKDEYMAMTDDVAAMEDRCEDLDEKNELLSSKNASLTSELAQRNDGIKRLERDNERLLEWNEKKTQELADELSANGMLSKENGRLHENLEKERTTRTKALLKLVKAVSASANLAAKISAVEKVCEERDRELAEVREAAAATAERLSNLEKDNEKLALDNRKHREAAEKQQHRADKLQEEVMIKVIEAVEAAKATMAVLTGGNRLSEDSARTSKTEASPRDGKECLPGVEIHTRGDGGASGPAKKGRLGRKE